MRRLKAPLGLLLLTAVSAHAVSLDYTSVDQYLRGNRPDLAMKALTPHEDELAGEVAFDYRYGLAMLNSGKAQQAIFVLERVVAVEPEFFAGRMDLARAYYETGDIHHSRVQFNYLLAVNPPAKARTVIQNYLAAIQQQVDRAAVSSLYQLELGIGADTNANNATSVSSFLGFNLSENSREQSAMLAFVAGNHQYSRALSARSELQIDSRLSYRHNFTAPSLDVAQASSLVRYARHKDRNEMGVGVLLSAAAVDEDFNQASLGLEGDFSRLLAANLSLKGNLRLGMLRFDDALSVRDVDQVGASLGLVLDGSSKRRLSTSLTATAVHESAVETGSPYSRDLLGIRLETSGLANPWTRFVLSAGYLDSSFDGNFFGSQREDTQMDVTLAAVWQNVPAPQWSLKNWWRWTQNTSNVSIFEHDGFQLGLSIARQFD